MKQETIEEDAINHSCINTSHSVYIFTESAKLQQEKFNVDELKFIYKIISFYWVQYNNQHEDNLKDFELSKSVLNKLKKQNEKQL